MPEFNLTKRIIKPCGNNCIAVHLSESEEADPEFEACGELLYSYGGIPSNVNDEDNDIGEILTEDLCGLVSFFCRALQEPQTLEEELQGEDVEGYWLPVCICLDKIKEI